jgi:hypothetical protein
MRRILLASDFSQASRPALTTAVRMAKHDHAKLTILHVAEPTMPVSADQSTAYAGWDQHEKQLRAWAQRQLARLTAAAKPDKGRGHSHRRQRRPRNRSRSQATPYRTSSHRHARPEGTREALSWQRHRRRRRDSSMSGHDRQRPVRRLCSTSTGSPFAHRSCRRTDGRPASRGSRCRPPCTCRAMLVAVESTHAAHRRAQRRNPELRPSRIWCSSLTRHHASAVVEGRWKSPDWPNPAREGIGRDAITLRTTSTPPS